MKKIRKFKIRTRTSKTGKLVPINFDKNFQKNVKRVFFLYGKKGVTRGNHAHKKCNQLFIPLFGKFILHVKTPQSKRKIILNHKSKISILIPPKYWCSIKFAEKKSLLMVACDQYYKANDYLRNYNNYKKYKTKK